MDAANLVAGHRLLNDDASWAEVVSVSVVEEPLLAYNLTVAGFHTYFVAANENASPVWVHNNCFEFSISGSQFGKKSAQHMRDFGLNVADAADRQLFKELVEDVATNHNISISGLFSGQGGPGLVGDVQFLIKGNDVVVTKPNGAFVTILKDGANTNTFVKNALDEYLGTL